MRVMKASLTLRQRQCIAVFVTAWFASSCGVEGIPVNVTVSQPELGAANEESGPETEPVVDSENTVDIGTPSTTDEESEQSENLGEGDSPDESEPPDTDGPDEQTTPPDESEPVEENNPTDTNEPVEENNPAEESEPGEENTPAEENEPGEESNPTEDNEPADENNPTGEDNPPVEPVVNLAPIIHDTSYACDPILEVVSFAVGETDNFILSIDDEFPLSMTFMADSSSPDVMDVSVDENGIFTATALQPGESYLWLSASDHEGLVDEYELTVIVE